MEEINEMYKFLYPRKIGKSKGITKLTAQYKKAKDKESFLADLRKAMENYAHHTRDTETQYIKHFSSFVTDWQDWIEIEDEGPRPLRPVDKEGNYID